MRYIAIFLFILTGCAKSDPVEKIEKGCYLEHGSRFTKWKTHHYIYTDSAGTSVNQLSNGTVWVTANLIKIQTSVESTCQYFQLNPQTQEYTMNGQVNVCGTPYGIEINLPFIEITIPSNINHLSGTCYAKIVGQVY